jgi:hypothetical protein
LRSFNSLGLGLDGGSLGKQGFSVSLQGHGSGDSANKCRELALVTRFRLGSFPVVHSRTPSED